MITAEAPAKLNLSLHVKARSADGLHPLHSLVQTIAWCDKLRANRADEDAFEVSTSVLPVDEKNLAWRAVIALRGEAPSPVRLRLYLDKRIPEAAGLGGGSSDAAAALLITEELHTTELPVRQAAESLGADVPFFLQGGLAWMEGSGEVITSEPAVTFAVAVVVPPFELSTAAVYSEWDKQGGPTGVAVSERFMPPELRQYAPFANDLHPAAAALRPELEEWREELGARWDRPAMLSGSGPALFAAFPTVAEAEDAAALAPPGARAAGGFATRARGAALVEG